MYPDTLYIVKYCKGRDMFWNVCVYIYATSDAFVRNISLMLKLFLTYYLYQNSKYCRGYFESKQLHWAAQKTLPSTHVVIFTEIWLSFASDAALFEALKNMAFMAYRAYQNVKHIFKKALQLIEILTLKSHCRTSQRED